MSGKLRLACLILVLLLGIQLFYHLGLLNSFFFEDEGYYLTYSWLIKNGYLIYRDFFDFHSPGIGYLGAALFTLFGDSMAVARAFSALVQLATTLAVFTVAKEFFDEKTALLSSALYVLLELGSGGHWFIMETFVTLPLMAALLLMLMAGRKDQHIILLFASGFFSGVSVLFKQPAALAALLLPIAFSFLINKKKFGLADYLTYFTGLLVPIAFVALFFASQGILSLAFYDTILFNFQIKGLRDAGFFPMTREELSIFGSLLFIVPLVFAGLLLSPKAKKKNDETRNRLAFLAIFSIACAAPAFARLNAFHLLPAFAPLSILAAEYLMRSLFSTTKTSVTSLIRNALVFFALTLLVLPMTMLTQSFGGNSMAPYDEVCAYVHSILTPQQKIAAIPFSIIYYFQCRRFPVSRQLGFTPWTMEPSMELEEIAGLNKNEDALVIYELRPVGKNDARDDDYLPILTAFLEKNYEEKMRFNRTSFDVAVLARKA